MSLLIPRINWSANPLMALKHMFCAIRIWHSVALARNGYQESSPESQKRSATTKWHSVALTSMPSAIWVSLLRDPNMALVALERMTP